MPQSSFRGLRPLLAGRARQHFSQSPLTPSLPVILSDTPPPAD